MHRWLGALCACLVLAAASSAEATTYYTSTTGNDTRSCATAQTITTPKATVNNAAQCLGSGDQLYVCAGACDGSGTGTFTESIVSPSIASGTAALHTKLSCYPGETVWLKPAAGPAAVVYLTSQDYVDFECINLDTTNATSANHMGGLWVNYSTPTICAQHITFTRAEILGNTQAGDLLTSYQGVNSVGPDATSCGANTFSHLTIHGFGGTNASYGFYIHNSNNIIEDNDIYDVGSIGIQIYTSPGTPTGNIIRRNKIHNIVLGSESYRTGITLIASNTQIYDNLIYRLNVTGSGDPSLSSGISITGTGTYLANNTIANNTGSAFNIGPATSTTFVNNLTFGNSWTNNKTFYGTVTGTTETTNSYGVDPTFANAAADNYHLTASSTIAVDVGTCQGSVFTTDLESNPRPIGNSCDLGVYEFNSGSNPPPPPPTTEIQKYRLRFRKP